ncbi:uncharacterized protein PAC_15120 [Phialocephala subalpina]|uniref:Uncharacterized protein n=1 Tax=Phialocephala subalpina TaxID=576137 RepID=A0A1L7XJJ5_9HELO|nr:uncharacterized protein PAC_15120 [Phialocephala subalpina]
MSQQQRWRLAHGWGVADGEVFSNGLDGYSVEKCSTAINGGSFGTGYLYHLGPYDKYNASGNPLDFGNEYVLAAPKLSDDPAQFNNSRAHTALKRVASFSSVMPVIESLLKLADCEIANPTGALSLNSGQGDAQNLNWKLGLALNSGEPSKYDTLLNTYETEPIATRVAKKSLSNMRNHGGVIDNAIGITPGTSTAENIAAMEAYFDPKHAEYEVKRERITEASKATDYESHGLGIETGWLYPSVDFEGQGIENQHGGQLIEDGSFDFTNYHPSTIPGHHLPHAWLQRGTEMASTRDLVKDDKFVLITEDATS